MKFFLVLIGFVSLAAGALAKEADPRAQLPRSLTEPAAKPSAIAQPFNNAVHLEFALIKAFGDRKMCLAAIKTGAETHIQLQGCDKNNVTQIWRFRPKSKAIQLAFPLDETDKTQCLSGYSNSTHSDYLNLAPCNSTLSEQQFLMTSGNRITVGGKSAKKCIDVPAFSYAAGTRVLLYKCKFPVERNQQWLTVSA